MSNRRYFTELSRVQIPAILHLTRLGYTYFRKISEDDAGVVYEPDTNILLDVFEKQFDALNPNFKGGAAETLAQIKRDLDNDDLGRSFYKRLVATSPIKLIDFEHIENNAFHCVGEFTCKNGQDEFRPDVTLFVNGLPLAFLEVKKPNNRGGMLAESKRMNMQRFPNRKFRRFINITQLMLFSNNMEYDAEGGITPIQGVFYCTAARKEAKFSAFREENPRNADIAPFNATYPYLWLNQNIEKQVLADFNCQVIYSTSEYRTNKSINTPTNRVLTSMCAPERFLFLLKYGLAYVRMEREVDGAIESTDQKHIMRYQQFFAAMAVRQRLSEGVTSGVIWHTQGSGKTALAYHLNLVLTDYFAQRQMVAKFYFIVDRLDLLEQASQEFEARGLEVKTANSRAELMEQFRTPQSLQGDAGKHEITVVNIQRFAEDKTRVELPDYATNLQRIFIVDEAHRGYNPKGSFLANLFDADPNSIKIALTGTPLLKKERASWKVFGDYIHTYYYDKSIQDGYTLKIVREDVETSYRERLSKIYDSIEHLVQKKEVKKSEIVEHDNYVQELLRFIITDFRRFRLINNDNTLGGMIVCETSTQARKMFAYFNEIQRELDPNAPQMKAELILHDVDDKETRKSHVADFKKNMTVDILIVFNMLLTGFDAPRLKKMYLGRKLKDHNLLQALTRVNRPYKNYHYGYVVDFADIKKNFEQTNQAYLQELSRFSDPDETGDANIIEPFESIIEDPEQLIRQVREARQILFNFDLDNAESFSSQISAIDDKHQLLKVKKALVSAKEALNIVRTFGDDDLKATISKIDVSKLPELLSEVDRAIAIMNQKEAFENEDETHHVINEAMADIEFHFRVKDKEEMEMAAGKEAEFQQKWQRTIKAFTDNVDQEDPEYITLREAFIKRFKEKGFVIETLQDFNDESHALDDVLRKLEKIKRGNDALLRRYNNDAKFVRVHKRIREENETRKSSGASAPIVSEFDEDIVEFLDVLKSTIDKKVYDRNDILKKDGYFEQTVMVEISNGMRKIGFSCERADRVFIQDKITKQYLDQYHDTYKAA